MAWIRRKRSAAPVETPEERAARWEEADAAYREAVERSGHQTRAETADEQQARWDHADALYAAALVPTPLQTVEEPSAALTPSARSRRIPNDAVAEVMRRDRGACVECGAESDLQLDHIVPFSMGGSNVADNLQVMCGPCNRSKGALRSYEPVDDTRTA